MKLDPSTFLAIINLEPADQAQVYAKLIHQPSGMTFKRAVLMVIVDLCYVEYQALRYSSVEEGEMWLKVGVACVSLADSPSSGRLIDVMALLKEVRQRNLRQMLLGLNRVQSFSEE